jgi:hypothetical protein
MISMFMPHPSNKWKIIHDTTLAAGMYQGFLLDGIPIHSDIELRPAARYTLTRQMPGNDPCERYCRVRPRARS